MAFSDKQLHQALIPSFLYSSSSSIAMEKMPYARPSGSFTLTTTVARVSAKKGLVIPSPSEPLGKIEMYSPSFYAACTFGGILSYGLTHTVVTPFDLVKCNMQRSSGRRMMSRNPLRREVNKVKRWWWVSLVGWGAGYCILW